jgi:hypothetical protein
MPRQYIDPQPLQDKITSLTNQLAALQGKYDALLRETPAKILVIEQGLVSKLEAAEEAVKLADEALGGIPAGDPDSPHAI